MRTSDIENVERCAAWEYARRKYDGDEIQIHDFMKKLLGNGGRADNWRRSGLRNVKINGENIKLKLADAAQSFPNVTILNHVNITDFLREGEKILDAYSFSTREKIFYGFAAKVTLIATGGASGIYLPNHVGGSVLDIKFGIVRLKRARPWQ